MVERAFHPDDPRCITCGLPFKDRVGRYALDSHACPWCASKPKSPLEYIDSGDLGDYVDVETNTLD